MRIIKPPHLQAGDTIGVVAPCLPLLPEFKQQFAAGIAELQALGFTIKEGDTLRRQHWWSGGTPAQQAADINGMFADPQVKALIASSGGHSAISVLELLDYDLIRKHPKPFLGMSDMTGYHLALYSQIGLVGFHMDEVCFGMGMNWQDAKPAVRQTAADYTRRVLTQVQPLGALPELRQRKTWRAGKAKGPLIGGNLSSLARQVGTPYFPPLPWFDGAILFWEAVGLHRYDIARMLYQLKYHGVFDRLAGMLVGTITAIQPARDKGLVEPTVKQVVQTILSPYQFPILAGIDCGHYTVNLPMPLGLRAAMDAEARTLALLEAAVR